MVKHHLLKSIKSFTLIELIIVIAIMSILSLIGVLFLSNWLGLSKDSRKISDLNIIKKSLDIYITVNGVDNYPLPDNDIKILDENNGILWYQGLFGEKATRNISSIQNSIFDSNGNYYEYSVTSDFKNYQVRAFLDEHNDYFSFFGKTKASNGINKTVGSFNGWLILNSNDRFVLRQVPSLFIHNPSKVSGADYIYLNDINNTIYIPNSIVNLPINSIKSFDITDFVLSGDLRCLKSSLDYFQNQDLNLSKLLNILKNSSGSSYVSNKSYFDVKTVFSKAEIQELIQSQTDWMYSLPEKLEINDLEENSTIILKKTIDNGEISKSLILTNNNGVLTGKFSTDIPTCINSTVWDGADCVIVDCKGLLGKGITTNGYYNLDIDGSGPVSSINVYCDMDNGGILYAANPNNLLGYWTFNSTFSDRSIHSRHGEVKGNPIFTQGIIGNAIKLKGTQNIGSDFDWVDIEDISIKSGNSWTISAWIKIDSDSYGIDNTMSLLGSNSSYSVISSAQGNSNWYKDGDGKWYNGGNSLGVRSNDGWKHSIWSSDGNKFYSYINGEKIGEVQLSNSLLELIGIGIGYKTDNYISTWDGYIDDLAIFDRELNADEIRNIYKLGVQGVGFGEK